MLILAGVSINAIVGDNGIVTMAMKAKELSKKAGELEDLQLALIGYSIGSYDNQSEALDAIVNGLFAKEYIDWIDGTLDDNGNIIDYNQYEDENGNNYIWVKKGDNSYRIFLKDDTYYADEMPLTGGGTLSGGTYVVTADAFNSGSGVTDPKEKGKFTIEGDTKVVFKDPLGVGSDGITASGEMLSIYVKKDSHVKVYFNDNPEKRAASDNKTHYVLTNKGLGRSAVDIETGGELDLVVSENVVLTVDSGYGVDAVGNKEGTGGFAGIHVQWIDSTSSGTIGERDTGEEGILNLRGKGTLISTGGNGSAGGTPEGSTDGDLGAGGGRSWCWNRR